MGERPIRRPTSKSRGDAAESLAADYLTDRGYRILTRNFRAPGGEIDLIAYDGEVLCFIEVRSLTNPAHGDPLETITHQKIRRVIRAARVYIETLPAPWPPMRFDAVGIVMTDPPDIRLIQEAFEA